MTYYELGELETALSASHAFAKYLKENTMVSEEKKAGCENLCKFVIKLINYNNTNSKTDLSSLTVRLNKCKTVNSKIWLHAKVQSLDRSEKKAV